MLLEDFKAENEFERILIDAKKGIRPIDNVLRVIAASDLYVSSKQEVLQDGTGFDPLLLEENGNPLVAIFSSLTRPELHIKMAKYVLKMNGREFFRRIPPGYGVVLNPGYTAQLIISPEAVVNLRTSLASAVPSARPEAKDR